MPMLKYRGFSEKGKGPKKPKKPKKEKKPK
jgi:hypothetical protein